jgi:hypothetical protein
MTKRTDLLYFGRMLDEARVAEEFLSKVATEEELTADPTLCRATIFTLQTIARMAQNVSAAGGTLPIRARGASGKRSSTGGTRAGNRDPA